MTRVRVLERILHRDAFTIINGRKPMSRAEEFPEDEDDFVSDLTSISSSIHSEFVDNLLAGISANHDESALDPLLLSRSAVPDITVFPSSIRFPNCFPHVSLSQKVVVSNSGSSEEHFRIFVTGDNEFQIDTSDITVGSGSTATITVDFHPEAVSLFQASLLIEGRLSLVVPLTGHCMPSPLDVPGPDAPVWRIPGTPTERIVSIGNRSYSMTLEVEFSSNSEAIQIDPLLLEISPGTKKELRITFDPRKLSKFEEPAITVKCEKTTEEFTIEMVREGPRPCMKVDFGPVSIGATAIQPLQLRTPQIAPEVHWPFGIVNQDPNRIEQSVLEFAFISENEGVFQEEIKFEDFDVMLLGTSVVPPYQIRLSRRWAQKPIVIRNMEDHPVAFEFAATPASAIVDVEEAYLRPKETVRIHVICPEPTQEKPELLVTWECKDGRTVLDHIELPCEGEEDRTELSVQEMEERSDLSQISQSTHSDTTSKSRRGSPAKIDTTSIRSRLSPRSGLKDQSEAITCSVPVSASTDMIPFFGVGPGSLRTVTIVIECREPFTIVAPEYVSVPDGYESGKPIELTCAGCPFSEVVDALKVYVRGELGLKIPIVSYQGSSNLEFETLALTDGNEASVTVKNNGERPGFVMVNIERGDVKPSRSAMIVQPFQSESIRFRFSGEPEKALVSLTTGDELVRQLKAKLRPSDRACKLFTGISSGNEIALIKDALFDTNHLALSSLLRKCMPQTTVRFMSSVQIAFSPAVLEFNSSGDVRFLTITNNSKRSLDVDLKCRSAFVSLEPTSLSLDPNSDGKVVVRNEKEIDAVIIVSCGSDRFEVPIRFTDAGLSQERAGFSVSKSEVSFGNVDIGLIESQKLQLRNISKHSMSLRLILSKKSPFKCCESLALEAGAVCDVDIEFAPFREQLMEETLVIKSDTAEVKVLLKGRGTADKDETILSQGDLLTFPPCELGLLRRARVKVMNRTSRRSEIEAFTDPPFLCPIPSFSIEPRSFVLFPVHFCPKSTGSFEGTLEFRSQTGKSVIIDLRGVCQ